MARVTIIVPIYNVEKYIERCVRSLFAQTLDDIEFIFIDDCTPDRSMVLLESEIEKKRPHFEVMNWKVRTVRMPTNSGLPAVRRHGIRLATGDYIFHCDSDDWIAEDMLSEMWKAADKENLDIVVCDYYEISDSDKTHKTGGKTTNIKEYFHNVFLARYSWALWNKLIKRSLYTNPNFIFPSNNMGEDMAATLQLLGNCKSMGYIPRAFYYYYSNPSSITQTKTDDQVISNMLQWKENVKILEKCYKDSTDKHIKGSITYLKYRVKNYLLPIMYKRRYRRLWKETFPEINLQVYICPWIDYRSKLYFLLTYIGVLPLAFTKRK